MERAKRFELSTLTLARLCSTPELRPHPFRVADLYLWAGHRKTLFENLRDFFCGGPWLRGWGPSLRGLRRAAPRCR